MGKLIKNKEGKWVDSSAELDQQTNEQVNQAVKECIDSGAIRKMIKDKRKQSGIKQSQLADDLGITVVQYSRIESGASVMNINQMMAIFNRLGISIRLE